MRFNNPLWLHNQLGLQFIDGSYVARSLTIALVPIIVKTCINGVFVQRWVNGNQE